MSNQDTISNFYSTTKFVNFIKDTYPNNEFTKAVLYFEGVQVFKNKFDKYCCKPLFITLESANKKGNVYLNVNKITSLFGDSIIVSFNGKFDNKDHMYVLVIEFESKAFMDSTYYPSHVLLCKNEHNIKCIRDQFKINYDDGNVPVSCFI